MITSCSNNTARVTFHRRLGRRWLMWSYVAGAGCFGNLSVNAEAKTRSPWAIVHGRRGKEQHANTASRSMRAMSVTWPTLILEVLMLRMDANRWHSPSRNAGTFGVRRRRHNAGKDGMPLVSSLAQGRRRAASVHLCAGRL